MLQRISVALLATALVACSSDNLTAPGNLPMGDVAAGVTAKGGRPASTGVIFVTSQGLYYDTFGAQDPLPSTNGPFQLLASGQTEFGPGDPGYLGGRWWEDTNGNSVQDASDHYFLCPLLGPGRLTP
jgi:hypothetical protein